MTRSISIRLALSAVAIAIGAPAFALAIRDYRPARHDRFTGFPSTPVLSPTSWFNGSQYTGLGWLVSNPQRQFALVSPQHFVMATHYGVSPGDQIAFLSPSGAVVTATIDSTTTISDGTTTCDLTLGRFTAPIPSATGITPFPYLNLPSESNYTTTNLQVFGFDARAGRGILSSFSDQTFSGTSRMYQFSYPSDANGLNQDDCFFIVGDSGSPTFASANSAPALMGVHSGINSSGSTTVNFDTCIRQYVTQLNLLMAADGYAMTPAYTTTATLMNVSSSKSPSIFRQAATGSASFTLKNSNASDIPNPVVVLTFPAGKAPDSVTVSGWTADPSGPQKWTFHRSSLTAHSSSKFTATWATLPSNSSLAVEVEHHSDTSPVQTAQFDLAPVPSYAAWSAGLAQPGTDADPDQDGRTNLVEYAFGSNPSAGDNLLFPEVIAGPVANGTTIGFPVRTDSQSRGLTYTPEYSSDLITWVTTAPTGTTLSFEDYSPAITGFKKRIISLPTHAGKQFVRVRTILDETKAGMTVP